MFAAAFAVLFGLSLLPGRKPLCLRFAERISDGIMPEGGAAYCRGLTWVWFAVLALVSAANAALAATGNGRWTAATLLAVPATFVAERAVRNRRFAVEFHTSGTTGRSRNVRKTFENLAREVAYHRAYYAKKGFFSGPPDERPLFIATIDPEHMYGTLWRKMLPAAAGCRCDPDVVFSPESLVSKMEGARSVFLVTTPTFLDRFTAYAGSYRVPQNCVEIVTSGSLLSKDISERARGVFGIEPRQIFGSTETGGVASRRGCGDWNVFETVRVRSKGGRLCVRSPYSFRRGWYVMGDGAEIRDGGRSFRLLGRMDRLVKINEQRVNLEEMEGRVRSLGFADCALAVLNGRRGTFLGCVLAAAGEREGVLSLRRRMRDVFPGGTMPRRFRYVREIPRNAQGKVVLPEILRILESDLTEPEMKNAVRTDRAFSAELRFDASMPCFQGHFPGAPVLPGVAQLGFAVRCAETLAGRPLALKSATKLKFLHVVEPGMEVGISVESLGGGLYSFKYEKGGELCSSGRLQF